jgi:hypothetical protein
MSALARWFLTIIVGPLIAALLSWFLTSDGSPLQRRPTPTPQPVAVATATVTPRPQPPTQLPPTATPNSPPAIVIVVTATPLPTTQTPPATATPGVPTPVPQAPPTEVALKPTSVPTPAPKPKGPPPLPTGPSNVELTVARWDQQRNGVFLAWNADPRQNEVFVFAGRQSFPVLNAGMCLIRFLPMPGRILTAVSPKDANTATMYVLFMVEWNNVGRLRRVEFVDPDDSTIMLWERTLYEFYPDPDEFVPTMYGPVLRSKTDTVSGNLGRDQSLEGPK